MIPRRPNGLSRNGGETINRHHPHIHQGPDSAPDDAAGFFVEGGDFVAGGDVFDRDLVVGIFFVNSQFPIPNSQRIFVFEN